MPAEEFHAGPRWMGNEDTDNCLERMEATRRASACALDPLLYPLKFPKRQDGSSWGEVAPALDCALLQQARTPHGTTGEWRRRGAIERSARPAVDRSARVVARPGAARPSPSRGAALWTHRPAQRRRAPVVDSLISAPTGTSSPSRFRAPSAPSRPRSTGSNPPARRRRRRVRLDDRPGR